MKVRPFSAGELDRLGTRLVKDMGFDDGPDPEDLATLDLYQRWLGEQLDDALDTLRALVNTTHTRSYQYHWEANRQRWHHSKEDGGGYAPATPWPLIGEPSSRPKRLESIVEKLRRQPRLTLSRMQDVVGARFVRIDPLALESVFVESMQLLLDPPHGQKWKVYDRRARPSNNYRALHLVRSSPGPVEIQLRTAFQHEWAELSEQFDRLFRGIKYGSVAPEGEAILSFLRDLSSLAYSADLVTERIEARQRDWHVDDDEQLLWQQFHALEDEEERLIEAVDTMLADARRILKKRSSG